MQLFATFLYYILQLFSIFFNRFLQLFAKNQPAREREFFQLWKLRGNLRGTKIFCYLAA